MDIILRRVYAHDVEPAGIRVLVDRLWPRGISKSAALWDVWLKDIAPSDNLRKWFAHDEAKWPEFKERYFAELDAAPAAVAQLQTILRQNPTVILLYAAKDTEMNNAAALRGYIEEKAREN